MKDVNAHLHTPYSFSAFSSVEQALDAAAAEGVKVVGINDFYSTDGYKDWKEGCAARALFPLFGIEKTYVNVLKPEDLITEIEIPAKKPGSSRK